VTEFRILQLCTAFPPGGVQRHILDVSAWLRARNWRVAFGGTPGAWMNEEIDPEFFSVDIASVAAYGGALPRRVVAAHATARRLRQILKQEHFDLIHTHDSAPALVAKLASFDMKIPIALTFHGAEPKRVREFGMIAKRCADHVLTPSRMSADELAEVSGIPREKIHATGLGVHQPPAMKDADILSLRRRFLGEGDTLIVSIARLAHQKAIDHLVAVAKRVHARHPGARFVIVGDGPQRREAETWIREAGLGGVVKLAGASNIAHLFLAASDIFFLPSRWESLPITIVEAFRASLPVVATDTGGVKELVDDSVGAVTPVGDIDALTERLSAFVSDKALRSACAAAAQKRSREDRFDPDAVNQKMADLYLEMISPARDQRRANG